MQFGRHLTLLRSGFTIGKKSYGPAKPIPIGEALEHPQTRARGMVVDLHYAQAGNTRALACPLHFSRTPTEAARAAPMLGEHTREVLREFGYQDAEIDRFVTEGGRNKPIGSIEEQLPAADDC